MLDKKYNLQILLKETKQKTLVLQVLIQKVYQNDRKEHQQIQYDT